MANNETPVVITLWETYGSNMEAVAAELASRTGMKVHKQAFTSEEVEAASQKRESEGILGQFFRGLASHFPDTASDPSRTLAAESSSYTRLAQENTEIVRNEAAQGGILMGRNGQFLLSQRPNTLHVKLDGPIPARVANAAKLTGIDEARAAKRQELEDSFRSDFSQKTYRFDPRDNQYYDVVVNGAGLGAKGAADVILAAAKAKLG